MNLALLSGTERMMQNHKNGLNTQKKYLDPDVNGMAGEIAVAKYFNRYPDLTIGPHYSGYDLMIAGKKVDVKTTTRNPGWLQAKLKKKVTDADIYIMVTADMPHYTIQGGATAQDLIQQHNIKDDYFIIIGTTSYASKAIEICKDHGLRNKKDFLQ